MEFRLGSVSRAQRTRLFFGPKKNARMAAINTSPTAVTTICVESIRPTPSASPGSKTRFQRRLCDSALRRAIQSAKGGSSFHARRSRKLLASTDTLENDIAPAAIIGLSNQPVNG